MPPFSGNRAARRPGGFTLVELLLVVMLLGLMAGVAAPRYQAALDDVALRTAVKRLAADLRHARQQARTRAEACGLEFLPGSEHYRSLTTGHAMIVDPDSPESGLSVLLDSRVAIAAVDFDGAQSVSFDFRGDPASAGSVTLSNRSSSVQVAVNALGEVTVTP